MGDGAWDSFLEVVSWGDWITPAWNVANNVVRGGGYGLNIPTAGMGMSGRDVCKILKQSGVDYWAPQIVADTFIVNVRKDQAARACTVLKQKGVTVENPPHAQPHRKARGRSRRGGMVGDVFSVFDIFG